MYRRRLLALVFGACSGCSTSEPAVPASAADAGIEASAADAAGTFGAGGCGACVRDACAPAESRCDAEPTCARFLACARACPTGAEGRLDEACAARCPAPEGAAATRARADWDACRQRGDGARCAACGGASRPYTHPLLTQKCDGTVPPYVPGDAGCDPTTDPIVARCRRCQYEKCCDTRRACDALTECNAIRACVAPPCGEPGASDATCYAAHPAGVDAWVRHNGCAYVLCLAECLGRPVEPCVGCWRGRCGDELIAYEGSPSGGRHGACVRECADGDRDCRTACDRREPEGYQAFARLLMCIDVRCHDECAEP